MSEREIEIEAMILMLNHRIGKANKLQVDAARNLARMPREYTENSLPIKSLREILVKIEGQMQLDILRVRELRKELTTCPSTE